MQLADKRNHISEDLQGVVRGELLLDDLSCALFSTDASIFQVQPLGVFAPRDEEDVQNIVRYAAENEISLIPRGAGSGLAGESLGRGLILDFTRYFRRILDISAESVRLEPGVVYRDLNARLAPIGRRLAIDTASSDQCTIGGMIATNASGGRAVKYGYMRDHVVGVRAVFDNGEAHRCSREAYPPGVTAENRKSQIAAALGFLLQQNAGLIAACQPRTRFNRCGYLLDNVLTDEGIDLGRLLAGSEGTLAVVTEATLKTIPLPLDKGLTLLGFPSLDAAARAAAQCLPFHPSACDLLDRRLLSLGCEAHPEFHALISPATQAVLLVEFEADVPGQASESARALGREFQKNGGVTTAIVATSPAEVQRLWRLRTLALPMLYGLHGNAQPIAFVEDVGVPVEHLAGYLHHVQGIMQKYETTASYLVHAAAGQVHTRPFLDLRRPENVSKLRSMAEEIYDLVIRLGGTISTQHGVGMARTPWVPQQYGRLFQLLREIKTIFDPHNLFNPGKIVAREGDPLLHSLRQEVKAAPASVGAEKTNGGALRLRWGLDEVQAECHRCNGCGNCRTEAVEQRMCPLFRAQHTEAATPRAKANLFRSLLDGTLAGDHWTSTEMREVADLCVNCKMCALECPAHVNIPKLMLEAKASHFGEHGLHRRDWALARTGGFAAFGSAFALMVNPALRSPGIRWLLERVLGVSRKRRLPTFARRNFLNLAARRGWTRPPRRSDRPRVAYFADVYATYNDPTVAEAAVTVLQHNGVDVYVPEGQVSSGMAPLAYGDVKTARQMALENLAIFGDLARAGYTIICSEPTAALMFKQDYLDLVDDPDVRLVGHQTQELTAFLWGLHGQGRLRTDFHPLNFSVGHHVPCHLKALRTGVAGPALLSLIPQLRTHTIDVSCSGMAGTFGLKEENFAVSLAAGAPMLQRLRHEDLLFGSSECSTCRMQMEEGAGKRSLHPAQYLAIAYGLMPEIEQRLRRPIRDLVL